MTITVVKDTPTEGSMTNIISSDTSNKEVSFFQKYKKSIIITSAVVGVFIILFLVILFSVILKKKKALIKKSKKAQTKAKSKKLHHLMKVHKSRQMNMIKKVLWLKQIQIPKVQVVILEEKKLLMILKDVYLMKE